MSVWHPRRYRLLWCVCGTGGALLLHRALCMKRNDRPYVGRLLYCCGTTAVRHKTSELKEPYKLGVALLRAPAHSGFSQPIPKARQQRRTPWSSALIVDVYWSVIVIIGGGAGGGAAAARALLLIGGRRPGRTPTRERDQSEREYYADR
ncbi:hypothetical protein EVAR_49897_1 [Eumeta japonica]|uniref:Uncharacterized protein n=1 Tax=Eumeta variegata TaxID=151549 RepID=A0A4C1Y5H4_EUMVA|nr:hypothetical protein EVAR_49897_1 [Eumeta japonica]